ncbi:MAG: PH domain-containing protein [Luteolibacter sp.]
MKTYTAPWGKSLKWISGICIATIVFAALFSLFPNRSVQIGSLLISGSLLLTLIPCSFFTIRSYRITQTAIHIQRLCFISSIGLENLKSAEFIPSAMKGSLRTFGNGGLFSWTGKYWNKDLGSYRAFVTDLNKTVVLRFTDKIIVISPESPEDFIKKLQAR